MFNFPARNQTRCKLWILLAVNNYTARKPCNRITYSAPKSTCSTCFKSPYTIMEPKSLPFEKELVGISKKTLEIHHDKLYVGYVKKAGEISEKLVALLKSGEYEGNATYSELRALKAEETFAVNEQKLVNAKLRLPSDIKPGNYLLYAKVTYNNQTAVSSSIITVAEKTLEKPASRFPWAFGWFLL